MTSLLDLVPEAIGRVQREIVLARFIGKLAVDQGIREVRQRLESTVVTVEPSPEPVQVEPGDAVTLVDAATLALADYDHLPAADIVAMLTHLEPDELDAIEVYESQNRHRRTVLGKLAQLRDA